MKPRHFWALYRAKTEGQKRGSELKAKDARRLKMLLERERAKDAAKA
jgi:hypothetical protein